MKSFNLKKYIKKAFYDDARGYWNPQTRAWMNCYKCKSDDGKGPQEAWNICLEEYNNEKNKGKWALSYTSDKDDVNHPYFDAKTPAAQKIIK